MSKWSASDRSTASQASGAVNAIGAERPGQEADRRYPPAELRGRAGLDRPQDSTRCSGARSRRGLAGARVRRTGGAPPGERRHPARRPPKPQCRGGRRSRRLRGSAITRLHGAFHRCVDRQPPSQPAACGTSRARRRGPTAPGPAVVVRQLGRWPRPSLGDHLPRWQALHRTGGSPARQHLCGGMKGACGRRLLSAWPVHPLGRCACRPDTLNGSEATLPRAPALGSS
jgi:hypothetical protein